MKTIIITLTAVVALTLTPRPAHALGDKEAAILGGVLGGAILGLAINDALDDDSHHSRHYHGDRPRSYDRGHSADCGCHTCRPAVRPGHGRDYHPPRSGYWTHRTVKVWIPKRIWYSYDDCGRRIRHFERGHWSYRKEKVWVSSRSRW